MTARTSWDSRPYLTTPQLKAVLFTPCLAQTGISPSHSVSTILFFGFLFWPLYFLFPLPEALCPQILYLVAPWLHKFLLKRHFLRGLSHHLPLSTFLSLLYFLSQYLSLPTYNNFVYSGSFSLEYKLLKNRYFVFFSAASRVLGRVGPSLGMAVGVKADQASWGKEASSLGHMGDREVGSSWPKGHEDQVSYLRTWILSLTV